MADTSNSLWATGRRKSAVARIRLSSGSGNITVNGRALDHYFPIDTQRTHATGPLAAVQATEKFDIMVNVSGGGPAGQAGAVRHGVARALVMSDSTLRPVLKAGGFLTRDSRVRERKKYGRPGARKRFQYSKR